MFLIVAGLFLALPGYGHAEAVAKGGVESATLPLSPSSELHRRMTSLLGKTLPEPVNCWGTALWAAGFTDSIRPGLKSELLNYLDSSACRKLGPNEPVRSGDIGSFYSVEQKIFHSYIVLDEQTVFEKASSYHNALPTIANTRAKFHKVFDLRSGCKRSDNDGRCTLGIVSYRCSPQLIEQEKNNYLSQTYSARQRLQFLVTTLTDAFQSGPPSAIDDAFVRYVNFIQQLLIESAKTQNRNSFLFAAEAIDRLMPLLQPNVDKLPGRSLARVNELSNNIDGIEQRTPAEFANFPAGRGP